MHFSKIFINGLTVAFRRIHNPTVIKTSFPIGAEFEILQQNLVLLFFVKKCELRTGMPEIKKIKADPINEATRNAIPEEFQNFFFEIHF